MRRTAILSAIQQHAQGHTVWIVDISPGERMPAYRRAGAVFVTMEASREELHARATAERPERWHGLIDEHIAKAAAAPKRPRSRTASGTC